MELMSAKTARLFQNKPSYIQKNFESATFYWANRKKRQSWPFGAAPTVGLGDSLKFSEAIPQRRPNPQ